MFDQCLKCIEKLPANDLFRLQIEAQFGPNPIESATKHTEKGGTLFKNWLETVNSKNLISIMREIPKIPNFFAGYRHFTSLDIPNEVKLLWAQAIANNFPKFEVALEYSIDLMEQIGKHNDALEVIKKLDEISPGKAKIKKFNVYMASGQTDKAVELKDSMNDISGEDKYKLDLEIWKKTRDDQILYKILDLEDTKELAVIKSKAVNMLGPKLEKDVAIQKFTNLLKLDQENGILFYLFGKYMINVVKDTQKGEFLLKKSIDLGYNSEDGYDVYTKDLIASGELDKALEYCKRAKAKWSSFRRGLIFFKQQKFSEAESEILDYLKDKDENADAWVILGFIYLSLGKMMACSQVIEKLDILGSRNQELVQRFEFFYEKLILTFPLKIEQFEIERTPYLFNIYLKLIIGKIREYRVFNRIESISLFIENTNPFIEIYLQKWGHLATVMKIVSDYYIEVFKTTKDASILENCQKLLMKRCENDRRGESFIDLARVMSLRGADNHALVVLRRAVKAFPDNPNVWLSLAITFINNNRYDFAMHCLTAASKISQEKEKSVALSMISALSYLLLDDHTTATKAVEESLVLDEMNKFGWEMKAIMNKENPLNFLKLAFEYGSEKVTNNLADYSLLNNELNQSLGYAFLSNDKEKISLALENQGNYEMSLLFTTKESQKHHLRDLESNDEKDASKYIQMNNKYGNLGVASCLLSQGRKEDAIKVLNKTIDLFDSIEIKDMLINMTNQLSQSSQMKFNQKNPLNILRIELLKSNDKLDTYYHAFLEDKQNIDFLRLFITQCLNSESIPKYMEADLGLAISNIGKVSASRDSIYLQIIYFIRYGKKAKARHAIQTLSVLSPTKARSLLKLIPKYQLY
ncbi:hypothetical protein TVAG_447430 [Trichomonas vaginalis G3]|uniref:TPR Domain containing protein n=1 Tax=Trichomonas vaginalis (strain ATCC PRA-98 / G3) TaxID=412133 RepID=A2DS14_TRIV3|nr:tetratricopeptide repeat protein 37 family [Trichomonas vaginalis G3]EAY16784.1 hypothetical protein TVAG_447430 [Trichomonas vaginalis G3]KAI5490805.1 tetratricopeptide repeat protein 37 family [Trichomonas vaginalis G3]|eukprot:XP_001329007.1 hypothetical protein [Trichomonas vaginalis G3]